MVFVVIVVRCLYPRKTLKTLTVLLVLADVSAIPALAVANRLVFCAAGVLLRFVFGLSSCRRGRKPFVRVAVRRCAAE